MILLSRTPLRISFLGGGTDYPEYFERAPGAVLGMSIDKYIHIAAIELNGIQEYDYRVSYSTLETSDRIIDIKHPVIREVLNEYKIDIPLDISIMSEMPANSGLGSSSSFTVGFINLVSKLIKKKMTKLDLAMEAIRIEQHVLKENVGIQDQLHASYGGLNRFDFSKNTISVTPILMKADIQDAFNKSLFLVYTGIKRHASAVLAGQMERMKSKAIDYLLSNMYELVREGEIVLKKSSPENIVDDFSNILDESWKLKRRVSENITNELIDELCTICKKNGAQGVKLCGAGSGGFILCLVKPEYQSSFISNMRPWKTIKIDMDTDGTSIVYR